MERKTFKTMMANPFGSKGWNKLDESQYILQPYSYSISIEDFSKKKYSTTERIDELYLINKNKEIYNNQFIFISEDDFRDYDIEVQKDNRKS